MESDLDKDVDIEEMGGVPNTGDMSSWNEDMQMFSFQNAIWTRDRQHAADGRQYGTATRAKRQTTAANRNRNRQPRPRPQPANRIRQHALAGHALLDARLQRKHRHAPKTQTCTFAYTSDIHSLPQ
jgi:hypothetical protein